MSSTITLVDVLVLRGSGPSLEALLLRRSPSGARPGSWEVVHGHLNQGELPVAAALRELEEETSLTPARLYNLSRVESFYMHGRDSIVLAAVFAAFVNHDAVVRMSDEHDDSRWLSVPSAQQHCAWPREARCLEDAMRLVGRGDAGALEDVLRVC